MTVQHTDPATAEDRPEIHSPSADDSEVPEGHAPQLRELTSMQEAKASHELSAPMSDNQLKRFGELIEMHADYGHALSIAGERLLLDEATYWRRIAHEQDVALTTTVDRHNAALSELEAAQARLDKAAELHKPERRYTPDDGITSYDTAREAAGAEDIPLDTVTFFEVCSHCASIEQGDHGGHDYRESLYPCDTARALGLGEEADDEV